MSIFRFRALTLCLATLAACAAPPAKSPADALQAREQSAVDNLHLKQRFPEVVTGTDVQGTRLVIYVVQDALDSMDVPVENAMIAQTFTHWKSIWRAQHPGAHAKLRLSVRNYYGTELTGVSGSV